MYVDDLDSDEIEENDKCCVCGKSYLVQWEIVFH
jgi:hypothetical protein